MELMKRADQEFKFPDGSHVTFEVEAISKADRKTILEQCAGHKTDFTRRGDNLLSRIDYEKFNRLVILRAIKGWTGLCNKHLLVIYDCKDKGDQWEFKGDKRRDSEIPYSEDAKRELAEMHSGNFMDYLNYVLDGIDEATVKAKEAELKN